MKRFLSALIVCCILLTLVPMAVLPASAASYLDSCTKYATSIVIKMKGPAPLMSLPCNDSSTGSGFVAVFTSGTELTVSAIYKNPAGEYWYEISGQSKKMYAYCGDTTLSSYDSTGDLSLDNVTTTWVKGRPRVIEAGKAFTIDGKVTSKSNKIAKVTTYIYVRSGSSAGTVVTSASSTSRNVADTGLNFKKVTAEGYYTYTVKANVTYRYSNDGKTLSEKTAADQAVYSCKFRAVKKYAAPKVTVAVANERLNVLITKLADGKHYFTTTGDKPCHTPAESNHGCGGCQMNKVIGKTWLLDLLDWKAPVYSIQGSIVHYVDSGTDTNGQSCSGFANFAGWYIFAEDAGNKVTFEKHYQGAMTKDTMQHAKPGDVMRSSTMGHSMIFVKANAENFTVLDCNYGSATYGQCIIRKHNISYNSNYKITISRATNYDIPTYAVTYDANGGSGAPGAQTKWKDEPLTLSKTAPTRTGYSFLGWATSATATAAEYKAGANYTKNAAVTLYAVWKQTEVNWSEPTYTWSEDNASVTAMRYNLDNTSQKEEETVSTTYNVTEDAGCETTGIGIYTAVFTNPAFAEQNKEVTIPALGHNLVDRAAQAPTCTEEGWNAYHACTRCDYVPDYEEIPALGHDIVGDAAVAPTCTETGLTAGEHCTRCDYEIEQETVPALGHDIVTDAAATATCTEPGLTAGEHCTRCDYKVGQETVPALGHNIVKDAAVAPTCTEPGLTAGEHCTRCDYKVAQEIVPALGHDIVKDAAVAPTCTATGLTAGEHCTRCDYKVAQEIVSALGHDIVKDAAVAPTCTETGLTAGEHCTRCDYKVAQEVIAALGHDWDEGKITTPATETTDGVKTYTCTRCGATKTELIPATGETSCKHEHAHPDHKDADCTEPGYDRTVCDDCGKVLSETVIPALGHDIVKDAAVAPTCTETGLTAGEHCTRCDYKVAQEVIAALGHDWDEGKITTPATETTDGVKTYTCTRCGATKTEAIPATGDKPCDGGATCPSKNFKDVNAGDWYHLAVDFAVKEGLFKGMTETTFEPNTPMTRGMLVTVLWRYEGSPKEGKSDFTDLTADWYKDAVAWAASKGIVTGVGNGRFDPDGKITREQLAAILFRYSDYKGYDVSKRDDFAGFPDKAKVSSWAKDAMGWAVAEKLITGNSGRLDPQGNATRAQVATILMRFIENIAE